MRTEPFALALNLDRLKLRGGNARGDSRVMNFDDGWKIGFGSIADSYSSSGGRRPPINFVLECPAIGPRLERRSIKQRAFEGRLKIAAQCFADVKPRADGVLQSAKNFQVSAGYSFHL